MNWEQKNKYKVDEINLSKRRLEKLADTISEAGKMWSEIIVEELQSKKLPAPINQYLEQKHLIACFFEQARDVFDKSLDSLKLGAGSSISAYRKNAESRDEPTLALIQYQYYENVLFSRSLDQISKALDSQAKQFKMKHLFASIGLLSEASGELGKTLFATFSSISPGIIHASEIVLELRDISNARRHFVRGIVSRIDEIENVFDILMSMYVLIFSIPQKVDFEKCSRKIDSPPPKISASDAKKRFSECFDGFIGQRKI